MKYIDVFKEKYEELMEEDVEAALEYCKESLDLNENADIHVYLGDALMANEDFEEAYESISRGIEHDCSEKKFAYSLKGESLFYLERYEESRSAFKEILKTEENNFFAIVYLIDIDIAESQYMEGIEKANIILNSQTLDIEDTAFIKTKKGWIMFKYLEQKEEAYELFKEALENDLKCSTAYIGLGSYYLYKENYIDAIINYEKALELGEGCSIVYEGMELARVKVGENNE